MARITGSYPDDFHLLIESAVEAGVFRAKSDAERLVDVNYWTMRDILRETALNSALDSLTKTTRPTR
jgi:hypothetical protein